MSEIADGIVAGDYCLECCAWIGPGDGYPRKCASCKGEEKRALPQERRQCHMCKRWVKAKGLHDHMRDAHGATKTTIANTEQKQ